MFSRTGFESRTLARSQLAASVILTLTLFLGAAIPAMAVEPGNEQFQRSWARTDKPVAEGQISRTWMWGPQGNTPVIQEPYAEAPHGMRDVQYFDKSRMEITDPNGDPNSVWYVTNGLLVVELITGNMQVGDNSFEQRAPAMVNVAGDADDPNGPTYATFGSLLDTAPRALGITITERVNRDSNISDDSSLAGRAVTVEFIDDVTNHAIAAPFWDFMNSSGTVYQAGQFLNDELFDNPFFATGRPITEAYWANVKVGGQQRDVLMQCFERRCLTYTPGNPDGFVVEAGNVGQHYYSWRYGEQEETSPATRYEFLRKWGLPDLGIEMDALVRTAVAPGGEIYLTGPGSDQVLKFDSNGTLLTAWGGTGTANGRFRGPLGVAVDSHGAVYVVDKDNNRIQKFDANGVFLTVSQVGTTGSSQLGKFNQPWDIAVGPDDLIYVTEVGNRRVQKFDQNLNFKGSWGKSGAGTGEFSTPMGIAASQNGLIYVSDFELDRVQIFDTDGNLVGKFGSAGSGAGTLDGPVGLDVRPGGDVYVAEAGNDRVQIFTPAQVAAPVQGQQAADVRYQHLGFLSEPDSFNNPNDIAFDASGTGYVLDSGNKRVQVFQSTGPVLGNLQVTETWTDTTRLRFSFGNPRSVEIGPDGLVYTLDSRQAKIKIFTTEGAFVAEWGPVLGPLNPGADFPIFANLDGAADLTFDHDGFIYVANSQTNRVFKLSPDGELVGVFGGSGTDEGHFDSPIGIAVDGDGNIYIADAGNDRVQKFGSDFNFITAWNGADGDHDVLAIPIDLAIRGSRIYVTDGIPHNRVRVFDLDGRFVASWSGFDAPDGVSVDQHGYIYVSDQDGVIQKFTPDHELLARFGRPGSGDGQINVDSSAPRLALDADGNVYVADAGNQRIQVFKPLH